MGRLSPPRLGSTVSYDGHGWQVTAHRPGGVLELEHHQGSQSNFMGRGTVSRVTTTANVSAVTVMSQPPIVPSILEDGPPRITDSEGNLITSMACGYQKRGYVAGGGIETMPTLLAFGAGSIEASQPSPGSEASHRTGLTLMGPSLRHDRAILLRALHGGNGAVIVEKADRSGQVCSQAIRVDGIERPTIRCSIQHPVAGDVVTFSADTLTGTNTTGMIWQEWRISRPYATRRWEPFVPGWQVQLYPGLWRIRCLAGGQLTSGEETTSEAELRLEVAP
ncbi:hypothetical protein CPCC7001_1445 [Cyanobium sp. PCC 7001]|uniref:hypothetical protein n=1 Tax=Cyanobium sp. PCC 7001 TaxID=180281 RepID=UPI0001805D2D|nr:hypothetical protein [Cyanobium sp. PCC 7001]EDY38566.1 hypothetical protein CPCC7001_1445 [Cyanobium sp. PCC 7001]